MTEEEIKLAVEIANRTADLFTAYDDAANQSGYGLFFKRQILGDLLKLWRLRGTPQWDEMLTAAAIRTLPTKPATR